MKLFNYDSPTLQPLFHKWDENCFGEIHEGALAVLEKTGVLLHHPEAREILKKAGGKIDGEMVYYPKELVNKSLEGVPDNFTMIGRDANKKYQIGPDYSYTLGLPSSVPFIGDTRNGIRSTSSKDAIDIAKFFQESQLRPIVGHNPSEMTDIPLPVRHLHTTYNYIRYSDKPQAAYYTGEKNASKEILEMYAIAFGGQNSLKKSHMVQFVGSITSPLCLEYGLMDYCINFTKANQIITLISTPTMGALCPATYEGALIQSFAEVIAVTVILQLIQPGIPTCWCVNPTPPDMKTLRWLMGSPEANLINSISSKMCNEFYGIPSISMAGTNDAKDFDIQLGIELSQSFLLSILSGSDSTIGCSIDSGNIKMLEQLVLEEEAYSRAMCIYDKIKNSYADKNKIKKAVEIIGEAGPLGNYMGHQSTFSEFRNFWRPFVSCWDNNKKWKDQGCISVADRCYKIYRERVKRASNNTLSSDIDRDLKEYLKKKEKDHLS